MRTHRFVNRGRDTALAVSAVIAAGNAQQRAYTVFPVNLPTGQPAHGPPRGLMNKMAALGLPPWAAWCRNLDNYAIYRMAATDTERGFYPKHIEELDGIWLNEKVRERVRTTRKVQFLFRQLKYPWMRTGVWYSDTLDHWVQVPHVQAATYAIEQDGGFDNFILKRSGRELRSRYGERIRRHILVRQREIEKNFVLKQHAAKLAETIAAALSKCATREEMQAVLEEYGLRPKALLPGGGEANDSEEHQRPPDGDHHEKQQTE